MRLAPAAALLALLTAAVASAQAPPRQGVIVFASNRTLNFGASDLLLSQPGRKTLNLTQSADISDKDPDISPHGKHVVFSRRQRGSEDLFTLTLPRRQLRQLTSTPGQYESDPVFSPTGDSVAFVRGTLHDDDAIWIVDLAGRERRLTSERGFKEELAWSPNGARLAFSDNLDNLFVINRDGSGLRQVAGVRLDRLLSWERSGVIVGFLAAQDRYVLRVIAPETGTAGRLANPCGNAIPTFSADRTHVLCHSGPGSQVHVQVRTRSGRPVRSVRIHPRNQNTQIRTFALGPRGRALVYDAEVEERHADIWLLGSRTQRLTGGALEDHDPAISPDRHRVVFVRSQFQSRRGGGALMVVDPRTRRVRPLRRGLHGSHPSWSPDGRFVVFASSGDLFVAGLAGGVPRRLTRDRNLDLHPTWSRDGRTIAFSRYGRERISLRTISPQGNRSREVYSTGPGDLVDLSWSPDGRSIAFSRLEAIYILSLETGRVRELVRDEANRLYSPTWSPDGRALAYASGWENDIPTRNDAHHLQIRQVDVSTGAVAPLIAGSGFNFSPDWR
jgi:Tol biopolymer transport system component